MNTSIRSADAYNRFLLRAPRVLLVAGLLLTTAHRLPAPIQEVPESPSPVPHQSAKPEAKRTVIREGPASSSKTLDATRKFDGSWVATYSKTVPEGRGTWIMTIVITNGKAAIKTIAGTYVPDPGKRYKSIDKVQAWWVQKSNSLIAGGSSLTIQWSQGQLSDWAPRTLSKEEAQRFGWGAPPESGPAVYTLRGNELTRVNDPNPVSYRRVK